MPEVGAYQAKTHLPRLLQEVEAGANFTITRNGRAVARLIPIADADDAATRILELRAAIKRSGKKLSMCALVEEGRR
jgi:prevent-host-death family protein